jgi:hypothetical protein
LVASGDDSDTPVEQFSRYIRRPKKHVEEEDNCGQPRPLDAYQATPNHPPSAGDFDVRGRSAGGTNRCD